MNSPYYMCPVYHRIREFKSFRIICSMPGNVYFEKRNSVAKSLDPHFSIGTLFYKKTETLALKLFNFRQRSPQSTKWNGFNSFKNASSQDSGENGRDNWELRDNHELVGYFSSFFSFFTGRRPQLDSSFLFQEIKLDPMCFYPSYGFPTGNLPGGWLYPSFRYRSRGIEATDNFKTWRTKKCVLYRMGVSFRPLNFKKSVLDLMINEYSPSRPVVLW